MRRTSIIALALLLSLIAVAPTSRLSAAKHRRNPATYAPGEVIVKLKASSHALAAARDSRELMSIAQVADDAGTTRSAREVEPVSISTANEKVAGIISRRGLDRLFVMKFDASADVDSIIEALNQSDEVEYAEPNYRITLGTVIPNDPQFFDQWPLRNVVAFVGEYPSTPAADIKATEAWDITTGSAEVIVAVTDTGIDQTHPDLARNIYTNPREIPGNGIDDDKNGYVDDVHGFNVADNNGDTSDIVGHGTQMAGVIAAEINNNVGISGVSQSKLLPVRFFKKTGPSPFDYDGTVADAARALLYSIAAGASIINASWRTLLSVDRVSEEESRALEEAVAATGDAGALLVCIAGNEGFNLDYSKIYPASYLKPNEIVVAASDPNDEIWHPPFYPYQINSGFGPHTVDLVAPGISVLTTQARGDCLECTSSDNPDEWYTRGDGTSLSAAYVSGVAALVKSRYPQDNGILIKRRIIESVDVREQLHDYVITSGRLNARNALTVSITVTPPVLDRIKYKSGSGKLFIYGSGIQRDVTVIVGGKGYAAKPKSEDLTVMLARVPNSAFPQGVAVPIKLRNPDGGESIVITYTR
ncbi:MAG TPA: S8 family serine peptidase [Blastocatellia bacterium]|nr:S8 family serine peptidase [Blastocatellia bacterium]